MAGTFTISGLSATEPGGERIFGPQSIQGTVVIGETLAVAVAEGDNTFVVPTGAVAVWITPPLNGASTLKVRTNLNSADAGLPISIINPTVYSFPLPAPTSLIVKANVAETGFLTIAFI